MRSIIRFSLVSLFASFAATAFVAGYSQTPDDAPSPTASRSVEVVPVEGRFALLIGVDDYPDGLRDLESCAKDAQDLALALETYADFPRENVTLMTFESGDDLDDPNAPTAENIKRAISELAAALGPDDFLFVAFSGHGVELARQGSEKKFDAYFCPCDVDTRRLSSFVSRDWVAQELESCRATRKLFFVDACRNEIELDDEARSKSASDVLANSRSFATPLDVESRGFLQMSSCGSGQKSLEAGDNGLFTSALIDGLRGAAANERGELTIFDWFEYARKQTRDRSKAELKRNPRLGAEGQTVQTPMLKGGANGEISANWAIADDLPVWGLRPSEWAVADKLYFEARDLRKRRDWEAAAPKIDEALKAAEKADDASPQKARYLAEKELIDAGMAGPGKAAELYEKGIALLIGMNKEKIDPIAAQQTLEEAAALGSNDARGALADFYLCGLFLIPDANRAFELATEAAKEGNPYAEYALGFCYRRGSGGAERDDAKSREHFQKAATALEKLVDNGDALAAGELADLYDDGYGVEKDEKRAAKLYRQAAERGNAYGQTRLGMLYENGIGVPKDASKAVELYRRAAEQNYAAAQTNLGLCYQRGAGVEKDEKRAVELYRQAAEQNFPYALYDLGKCYRNGIGVEKSEIQAAEHYRRALTWLVPAAEQNDANAQDTLGWCYENGTGVPKDEKTAVQWYRKAAEQDYAPAQNNLGNCYFNGTGVPKDEKNAVQWYRKAAEQDYAPAQDTLGWCYQNGIGVSKDEKTAVEWFRKAVKQDYAPAQNNLGWCYQNGIGVPKDEKTAVQWYRKAAEQEYAPAQNNLGDRYFTGTCVPKDEKTAVQWYRKAAEQEYVPAQNDLGICYFNGTGVPKDEKTAVEWFRKAAEQDFAAAQFNLGWCYENGIGVEKNVKTAIEWYRKAAAQGNVDAQKRLDELE